MKGQIDLVGAVCDMPNPRDSVEHPFDTVVALIVPSVSCRHSSGYPVPTKPRASPQNADYAV